MKPSSPQNMTLFSGIHRTSPAKWLAAGRPVASETLFYTYSTGKAMTSTVTHVLA